MKRRLLTACLIYCSLSLSAQNVLNSTGNVGIGTNTPFSRLALDPIYPTSVNAASVFLAGDRGILGNNAGSYLYPFEFQYSSTSNVSRLQFSPYRRVPGPNWTGTAYRIQFAVDNSFTEGSKAFIEVGGGDPNIEGGGFISLGTAGLDRLTVTNDGYVGIGTSSPKEALSVNGNIRSRAIKVEEANWPDYVFTLSYRLPDLDEVHAYIKQNQHLPDMPSAQQITEKGLDLGEMNKLLAKKVEELILYLIELKKNNDLMGARLKKLEDKSL